MTDRETLAGHPWAVFLTTFDISNTFEDKHSHDILRRHKLYFYKF